MRHRMWIATGAKDSPQVLELMSDAVSSLQRLDAERAERFVEETRALVTGSGCKEDDRIQKALERFERFSRPPRP